MVRDFGELTGEESRLAGGKGGTLARLYRAGYTIPDGFVILPGAFTGDELTPAAWEQVRTHLAGLRTDDDSAFAVRSSAPGEDSAEASFAGEFVTVLDVRTDEEVRDAIRSVRRSRLDRRVQAYGAATGVTPVQDIAVLVQQMVPADISGVLFTADPVSGSRRRMAGNFVTGLGDRLVSGFETGDSFTFDRPGGRYRGARELRPHARRLNKLARRLESELGAPQDIEWAIAGEKLYLLQSRPITTLIGYRPSTGDWNDSLTGDYLWSNVNFGEAVTEVMTPLSWTVLQFIFGRWVVLPRHPATGNIGGRPYLNISVFATVFEAMGKTGRDFLLAVEGTMYMRLPEEVEIPVIPISRRSAPSVVLNLIRMRIKEKRTLKRVPEYLVSNPAWCKATRDSIRGANTKAGLLSLWHESIEPHVTHSVWLVMASVSHYAEHTTRLRRDLTKLAGPDDADAFISSVGYRSGPLASLGPLLGLAKVASGTMEREAYLVQHGHRGPHEFELSVQRPAEDPAWFDQQLDRFRRSPVDPELLLEQQRGKFDRAWTSFRARHPLRARLLRRRIDEVSPRARMREAVRSEYTRDRWVVREFAVRAGELTGLGDDIFFLTLDEVLQTLAGNEAPPVDIPARRHTYERYRSLPPYPSGIRGRFDPFQWADDPNRRSDFFDSQVPVSTETVGEDEARIIVGCAGSAGRVEGVVRRLDSPEDAGQFRGGEILVTRQTDIAWTPLFLQAAAIVTDVGAPLSHAAIVARELGIAAVVGCGDATARLATGDRVRVDGGRGIVEVLGASLAPGPSNPGGRTAGIEVSRDPEER